MRIVIIGTGNVARVFFERIGRTVHEVVQVVGRKPDAGTWFSTTAYIDDFSRIDPTADIYIAAISDNALYGLKDQLHLPGKLLVHTAGSVGAEVLREVSDHYGVLYPLQTLRSGITGSGVVIPLLVDGVDENVITRLESFAASLSPLVHRADDATRLRLHLAAVVVNNFTNHLYDAAAGFCAASNIDFSLLQPLIEQTALQLRDFPPSVLQTGPARRGDSSTMQKHIALLQDNPTLKALYAFMSEAIGQSAPSR